MSVTVSTQRIMLVWRNGAWGYMPYRDYFLNNLKAHLDKIRKNEISRKREETAILSHASLGQIVNVNGQSFRYRFEKSNEAPHRVAKAA